MSPAFLSDALNVVIPIGGVGNRFATEGYRYPKPLINVVGRPMILRLIDNLSLRACDTLWIALNKQVEEDFMIGSLILKSFPEVDVRFLKLQHQTRGGCETLYVMSQSMDVQHLRRKTVALDCDNIYWVDILQVVREIPLGYGGVVWFHDDGQRPIFSYSETVEIDGLPVIVDIQEKKAISTKANSGAYIFATAELLQTWAARCIDSMAVRLDDPQVSEYYTSRLIAMMIFDGKCPFLGLPIAKSDFSCVGTPEQLKALLHKVQVDGCLPGIEKKRRFCFDLDLTLVGPPRVPGDYSTCPPIPKNIKLVQELYKAGHHIIIQTARGMRSRGGNVGTILKDLGPTTFQQLSRYEIPYHDVHFGKPWADVYIDDLAVNAHIDTERELGWLEKSYVPGSTQSAEEKADLGKMVAARDFNTVQIIGNRVFKSSKTEAIIGEIFFYAHLPSELLQVFPKVYAVEYLEQTQTYLVEMDNCGGWTFSHLLVGRSLTKGRLLTMLRSLHRIHATTASLKRRLPVSDHLLKIFESYGPERTGGHVNIYANYGSKLQRRYYDNEELYDGLGPSSRECFHRLQEFLDTYEAEDKGVYSKFIHGDPVFSNVVHGQDEQKVSFIDVRCQLDSVLTMEGDIHYDLAKVLQSLLGYDHILFTDPEDLPSAEEPLLQEVDVAILQGLQDVFWKFLAEEYAVTIHRKTLLRITASLLFSMIPLHKVQLGPVFLRMCKNALEQAKGIPFNKVSKSREAAGEKVVERPKGAKRGLERDVTMIDGRDGRDGIEDEVKKLESNRVSNEQD